MPARADQVPDSNSVDVGLARRLKETFKRVGGNAEVSRRTNIPVRTLGNYLAGRDMPTATAVAIADACQVRLDWLLAGRGTMVDDWVPPRPAVPSSGPEAPARGRSGAAGGGLSAPPPPPPRPPAMVSGIDLQALAKAIEIVDALSSPTRPLKLAERAHRIATAYGLLTAPEDELSPLPMLPEPPPDEDPEGR